ncbi:MAG: APC family permease [Firmicutes bacterium]|nr:APC family permease [Candidatus Fiminaster equi]
MAKEKQQLKKSLNPLSVWAIAFGCIIGWGSFINPGKKFLPNSGVAGTAIAMVLGALVMVIIAVSYAYMVPKHPKAGGEFTFTKSNFGKIPAFICGWFLVAAYLTNVPMNSTAIPLIMEGLFGNTAVSWGVGSYSVAGNPVYLGGIIVAVVFLVAFAILNILGVEKAGFIQKGLAITLAVCAFTLCISGIVFAIKDGVNFNPLWGFDKAAYATEGVKANSWAPAILATFAIAPWAFVGFDTIPQAAEEFKFPFKKVIKIMIIAIAFGAFVYISNNTICAVALNNWPELCVEGKWVVLVAAEKMLGTFGKVLVGFGVASAVLSGMMGFYLASSRLMWSMAKDGFLPRTFAKLDEKHQTPRNALIFCLIISLVGPFLGREALGWFVDMSSIGASIGFFFTCLCAAREIRRDKDGSMFKFICAITGCVFAVLFMILQLIPIPGFESVHFVWQSYVMLGVWVLLGVIFFLWQRKKIGVPVELE